MDADGEEVEGIDDEQMLEQSAESVYEEVIEGINEIIPATDGSDSEDIFETEMRRQNVEIN